MLRPARWPEPWPSRPRTAVDLAAVETNIVVLDAGDRTAGAVVAAAAEHGIQLSAVGQRAVRAVTHLGVTSAECRRAGEVIGRLLRS